MSMIVVSNRLPFVLHRDEDGRLSRSPSAGGLVTAMAPIIRDSKGIWVGWSGIEVKENDIIPEADPNSTNPIEGITPAQIRNINLHDDIFDGYYNGCCNSTFWPLFHSMPDRAIFRNEDWKDYVTVNYLFADETFKALKSQLDSTPDDRPPLIWIHDYQLMLCANLLRQTMDEYGLVSAKVAFFLHIPFPPWDIFRLLPWYDEVLVGLLGCDLIGFHIEGYVKNFLECCTRGLGCQVDHENGKVTHDGRTIRVQAFPIGIPFKAFEDMSKEAKQTQSDTSLCKTILGVDRLDYTKGIVHRVKAFEKLLDEYPEHREKVVLLQVAVPSRTGVQEYVELKDEIDREIGRINGRLSTSTWSPIRYIYRFMKQEELCSFYRDAYVALVTPIRDGMNLVAKEFVACQIAEPGVLILSPFTGAGETMHEALICNPLEEHGLADTIHRALTMPLDERELRMSALRRRERINDVHHWVRSFLQSTGAYNGGFGSTSEPLTIQHFVKWLSGYVGDSNKLVLLLDYDGTLSPIASHPDSATLPPETKQLLETLVDLDDVYISVISGRSVENVKSMVAIDKITYAGSHGLDIVHPDGHKFIHPDQAKYATVLAELKQDLQEICGDGTWLEQKGFAMTLHYRLTPMEKRPAIIEQATTIILKHGFRPTKAHCAVEARPPIQWDKGRASIHILRTTFGIDWSERVRIIYVGDDVTDEDAMSALKGMAITFRVANSRTVKTSATHRLPDTLSVQTLLQWVVQHMSQRMKRKNSMAAALGGP